MKLTLTIRRKLFLGFLAVVAVPLVMVVLLARSYVARTRSDLDQRFLEQSHQAFRRMYDADDKLFKEIVHEASTISLPPADRQVEANETSSIPSMSFDINIGDDEKPAPPKLPTPPSSSISLSVHAPILGGSPPKALAAAFAAMAKRHLADPFRVLKDGKIQVTLDTSMPPAFVARVCWRCAAEQLHKAHPELVGVRFDVDDKIVFEEGVKQGGGGIFMAADRLANQEGATVTLFVDKRQLVDVAQLYDTGRAFYIEQKTGRPWISPSEEKRVTAVLPLPVVTAIASQLPKDGGVTTVAVGGERYRVYEAARSEHFMGSRDVAKLVAVACESEIYEPLFRFRLEQLAVVLLSILLATGLSYYLSGRFVGAVENIQRGVDALSRGEFAQLQKSSGDELGSGLVESMNRMATVLQERTRKEEVEGWRRLVRVLSHEINNTLGPVRSVAVTVRDQVAPKLASNLDTAEATEDLQMAFRLIVDRVDSLSSFISGYAELAKLPAPARVHTDLNEVARAAVRMLKQSADEKKIIVHEVYSHEVRAQIDGGQIERVAINLIKNAIEAAKSDVVVRTLGLSTGVELIVEDDGPGISPEARRMLFVPYFTTKPGGSGIGLALARQIALGHGGSINAEDRSAAEGGGTLLRVILPSSVAPAVNSEG